MCLEQCAHTHTHNHTSYKPRSRAGTPSTWSAATSPPPSSITVAVVFLFFVLFFFYPRSSMTLYFIFSYTLFVPFSFSFLALPTALRIIAPSNQLKTLLPLQQIVTSTTTR